MRKSLEAVRKSLEADNRPNRLNFESLESHARDRFKFDLPFLGLTIRSLGIIYGDIGTSPLYVLNSIFTSEPSKQDVIGGCSLIVWSLFLLVTLKYVGFIIQA